MAKALPYEERKFPEPGMTFDCFLVFIQWKCRGKMLNRGWLQKERFCECSDNPATAKHYSSMGQAVRACRNIIDDDDDHEFFPSILGFSSTLVTGPTPFGQMPEAKCADIKPVQTGKE